VIIVSRIMHVKVDKRLNDTNKIKYQRRLKSRLAIVMFRGTGLVPFLSSILKFWTVKDDLCNLVSLYVKGLSQQGNIMRQNYKINFK